MLVSAKEMLTKAKEGHYAVGQFNINNLEWTKAILQTAQEMNSPVILGVSEGAGKYMCGYKTIVGMVEGMIEGLGITVPVALHLDHGSYEGALKCPLTRPPRSWSFCIFSPPIAIAFSQETNFLIRSGALIISVIPAPLTYTSSVCAKSWRASKPAGA